MGLEVRHNPRGNAVVSASDRAGYHAPWTLPRGQQRHRGPFDIWSAYATAVPSLAPWPLCVSVRRVVAAVNVGSLGSRSHSPAQGWRVRGVRQTNLLVGEIVPQVEGSVRRCRSRVGNWIAVLVVLNRKNRRSVRWWQVLQKLESTPR